MVDESPEMMGEDAGFEALAEESLDSLLGGDAPADEQPAQPRDIQLLRNIPVRVTLEVDSVEVPLAEVLSLGSGDVLALDKIAGAPLDVRVNGVLLGQAEVVVAEGKYGLRLLEVTEDAALAGLVR